MCDCTWKRVAKSYFADPALQQYIDFDFADARFVYRDYEAFLQWIRNLSEVEGNKEIAEIDASTSIPAEAKPSKIEKIRRRSASICELPGSPGIAAAIDITGHVLTDVDEAGRCFSGFWS